MNARKWMMEYGVAMVLTFVFAVILGHIPLFRENDNRETSCLRSGAVYRLWGALVIAWVGGRQLAAEPPEDWKWLMPYRALILPVTALAIVAIVASSVWLILSWVQKCAALVAAMDSRKLRKAA